MRWRGELQFFVSRGEVRRQRDGTRLGELVVRGRRLHHPVQGSGVMQHDRLRGRSVHVQPPRQRLVQSVRVMLFVIGIGGVTEGCAYDWTVSDRSDGSDASATDSGVKSDVALTCGDCPSSCTSGPCTNACDEGKCELGCTGDCGAGCAAGQSCHMGCAGSTCALTCKTGASCDMGCSGSTCTLACESGSTCKLACAGATCGITCAAGASCTCVGDCTCTGAGCP